MQILWFDELSSTQTYLKDKLAKEELVSPIAIVCAKQTEGIGSRGNTWIGLENNLFFSFAYSRDNLPDDLALESSSIYFSYLLKECLEEMNSKLWIKWPNDFYIKNEKVGGTITSLSRKNLICGIGLNLEKSPQGFTHLDIKINKKDLLDKFFKKIENKLSWKQIFSKYKIEFERSKSFHTHYGNSRISLENAVLNQDGSLEVNGKRIYSLR
ncbi:biotin--[acetyl-CoA-carboxylase] ligase [Sulfurimonas sp. MAG313]|nr:biotin--[acetyl-CoA-carboxylase] ligase [Sulfurimonas sp. MAG313]MDF1880515.1 biotin--[acetyl-CoA-carboxylase] ligase [Sulfurimonas sp. MAG313]